MPLYHELQQLSMNGFYVPSCPLVSPSIPSSFFIAMIEMIENTFPIKIYFSLPIKTNLVSFSVL